MTEQHDMRLNDQYGEFLHRWREVHNKEAPALPESFTSFAEGWHARAAVSKGRASADPDFDILRDELRRAWEEVDRMRSLWMSRERSERVWRRQVSSLQINWRKAGYKPEDGPAYKRIMHQRAALKASEKQNAYLRGVIQQLQHRIEEMTGTSSRKPDEERTP